MIELLVGYILYENDAEWQWWLAYFVLIGIAIINAWREE